MNKVLRVDDIYTDKMVVPENKVFKISGQATENTIVSIKVMDRIFTTNADENGLWTIKVSALPEWITTDIEIKNLNEILTLKDVKTGKVILLTGQSNIEFKFRDDAEYQEQIDNLNLANVYFYNVPQLEYQDDKITLPKGLTTSKWQVADKETLWEMSDIGYWIAKELNKVDPEKVIGIIDCYKGGTSISSWVPEDVLQGSQELMQRYIEPFKTATTGKTQMDYDQEFAEYNTSVEKHNIDLSKFQKENPQVSLSDTKDKVGHAPWPPPMTPTSYLRPNGLFHTMIEQVKNYFFNKIVWYQGENDADNPDVYDIMLRGLISSWRELFKDQSLPFYVVQLPGYYDEPQDAWAIIRQHQLEVTQTMNDVHLVSIADTGEKHNIHPTHKRIAGTRIGKILSDKSYNSTPYVYRKQLVGNQIILFVASVSALTQYGKAEIEVLKSGKWSTQEVSAVGSVVVINNAQGIEKIRYEYANYPTCTLFNEVGAPLAPFEMEIENE